MSVEFMFPKIKIGVTNTSGQDGYNEKKKKMVTIIDGRTKLDYQIVYAINQELH